MSRFKRIKNTSTKKSSVSINEKIAALNKELEKTGMLSEEPTMTTSNIYPEVSEEPNQDLINFEAIMTGGERLGFSGADGNTAGNASLGDAQGLTGVALSPPHPVTGVRIHAIHRTTGLGDSTPLRPGVTIGRGFSDNPPQYTMGSVLWFYDADHDNGAGVPQGKWCNLEYSNFDSTAGQWFFWDTIKTGQFAGIYKVETDLSLHPCGDISDLIDGLNFPNGSLGPPKIPILTVKGLETEPIYPGPIAQLFGLGQRGIDWLLDKIKGKPSDPIEKDYEEKKRGSGAKPKPIEDPISVAELIEEGIDFISDKVDINNNGEVDWHDMGRWINEGIKYTYKLSPFNLITAPIWDAVKGQEWVQENLENVNRTIISELNNFQQKFTGENMQTPLNWIEKFNEVAQQNPYEKSKNEIDFTDVTDIDTQIDLSEKTIGTKEVQNLVEKIKKVKGENVPLTDKQKRSLNFMETSGINTSGVENQEDFHKLLLKERLNSLIGSHDEGAIGSSEQLRNSMGGKPGTWVFPEDIDNFVETGELNIHKGIQSEESGYQFRQETVNLDGWQEFVAGLLDANPDTVGSGSLINYFGALAIGKLGLKPRLNKDSTGSQSQDLEETPPVPWIYTIKPVETILQENFLYNSPNFLLESRIRTQKRKEQTSKFGLEIGGFDGNMRPLTGKRKKNFNLVIPKKHRHKFNKKKSGSLKESLNESVKLGHFEPEVLNVDIENLRKGIMPEYPKKPPAKMIDGYHEKSRIRLKEPKNIIPTLKIDKTDLIRNHRLKPGEADEMMNTINMINNHIKKHPEDFIHAQQRYPVDDPRLAELNWKMDQMLDAGKEYIDSNFKVNQTLFKRATDRTKKNTALTNPDYIQKHYDELRGTIKPESKPTINRKSPSRFFKKPKKKSSMEAINDKIKQLDKDLLI